MEDKLLGYKIRGKYYMAEDVTITNSRRTDGDEMCTIKVNGGTPRELQNLWLSQIKRVYRNDDLSFEIYKLKIDQLESELKSMCEKVSQQDCSKCGLERELDNIAVDKNTKDIHQISKDQNWIMIRERIYKDIQEKMGTRLRNVENNISKIGNNNKSSAGQAVFNVWIFILILLIIFIN